jgi:hypothetical protein
LDADRGEAHWLDLGAYHCYEGFFHRSLALHASLSRGTPRQFKSSLDFLAGATLLHNPLPPSGFIFHAGRCRSTLLAKALARSRAHQVFGEAAAHNQVWRVLSGSFGRNPQAYRNLLLWMGRRRVPAYRAHLIKFTSFNIVEFPFVRAAFPGVPAVFLFRTPEEILYSYHRASPAWMGRELGIGKIWHTPQAAIEDFFTAALGIRDSQFRCMDYADLTPDSLPSLLAYFNLSVSTEDLRQMQAEFRWDAKGPVGAARIAQDPGRAALPSGSGLHEYYEALIAHSRNAWK